MNSSQNSQNGDFFLAPNPLNFPQMAAAKQDQNLMVENLSQSLHVNVQGLHSSIRSPENPLQQFVNKNKSDIMEMSLGISPQIQLASPQFQFPNLALNKIGDKSHNFEDSIDLKQTDSPVIHPLPVLKEGQSILQSIELTKLYDNKSAQLRDPSAQLKESTTQPNAQLRESIKASGFLMQSPQLDALEHYINKGEEAQKAKDEAKLHSRPGSGDPFLEKSPTKKSPMKKWKQKLEEERLALIETMMRENEEKRDTDEDVRRNEEEIKGYEMKIEEEIKSGTLKLKKAKTFEKENHIREYKKVYHRLYEFNDFLRSIYRKYLLINLMLDLIFAKCCSFFKGKLLLSKYFIIVAFWFTIIMIGYILGTNDAEHRTRSRTIHALKRYMASHLLPAALIATYYGVWFVQIRYYFIIALLFFIQFLPCLILLLKLSVLPPDQFLQEVFFAGLYLFWLLVFFIKEDVRRNFSESKKVVILIFWYVFGGSIFIGVTVYQIATSKTINLSWYHDYVATLCVPYVIFICLNWVYLHVRFIVPVKRSLKKKLFAALKGKMIDAIEQKPAEHNKKSLFSKLLTRNKTQENLGPRSLQTKKSFGDFLNVSEKLTQKETTNWLKTIVLLAEGFLKKFSRFLISIASFSTFGAVISITIYCLFYVLRETDLAVQDDSYPFNKNAVICCSFLILVVPCSFLTGIPLISSDLDLRNKLLLFPIFGLVLPICITLPIANGIQNHTGFSTLTQYLIYGPPLFAIFWLFLIYISQHGRRILFFVTTFFCLFFVVPIGFLVPLISADGFLNSAGAQAAEVILFVVGSAVVLLYVIYLFLRRFGQSYLLTKEERAKQPKFDLMNYFKMNCEIFGLFGNGVGFIVTITILIFGIFNKPSYIRPAQDGSLSGLIVIVCLLFIILTFIIRLPVMDPGKVYSHSVNDQFQKEFQSERYTMVKRQGLIRLALILYGFIIVPVILIPIIVVNRDDKNTEYLLLTVLIGNALIILIFNFFYSIKKNYEDYAKSLVPLLSIFCWAFIFIPFVAIIPITVINLREEEDIAGLYKITVGIAALIIFIGVGLLSIVGNLFFKRIEFEKKFKFVASKVIKMLRKNHVRSDYDVIRLAYEHYLTQGPSKAEENMNKARPVYYVKSSKFNPQTEYSKILISEDNYRKLKKRHLQTKEQIEADKKKAQSKRNKCWRMLLDACCPLEELKRQEQEAQARLKSMKTEDFDAAGVLKETEEEVLSQGSDDEQDQIYEKQPKPKKHEDNELGEAFNDILVQNIIKSNEEASGEENPEVEELKKLKARDLDPRIWNALKFYDFTDNLGVNEKAQFDLLKIVHKMFAFGDRRRVSMPWIDYVCYKELLRLSKIIPCDEIPDFLVDLTYTQFTTKNSSDFCNPILEYNFKELLQKVAVLRFPEDTPENAFSKLIRYYIFPLILWNMPEMQLHYPHEWDYVLFLMKSFGLGEDADETRAKLQRKIDNEKLLRALEGQLLIEEQEKNRVKQQQEEEERQRRELEERLALEEEKKQKEAERLRKLKEEEEKRLLEEERLLLEARKKQQEQKKLEKERRDRELRRVMKYWLCIKINQLCVFFFQSFCFIQTRGVLEDEQEQDPEEQADFHYAVDTLVAISNKKRTYTHMESPPWPELVHMLVEYFPEAEEEYIKKQKKEELLHMQMNFTNFMAAFSKLVEIYSMGSIALRAQIDWDLSPTAVYVLNALNNNIPITNGFPKFKFFFWLSFGVSVLYWFFGYEAVKKIRKGTFGVVTKNLFKDFYKINQKSTSRAGLSKDFVINLFINLASSSLYMIIMKSFMDSFSCNYDVKPWTLYEDPNIECNTDTHYIYVFFASLGVVLYYPLSSFLFPNIQFQNKALDLKYDPTFVVILTQIKLLISGTASFFPVGNGLIIQLTTSTIALVMLAFIDKLMKPCIIKRHNTLEVGGYLIAAWMCFSGLINVLTLNIFLATLLIIIGPIIIALFTLYFFCKHLRRLARIREEHKKNKTNSPQFGNLSPQSPGKSPISSISPKQKEKEQFDFSKKVNQFDDFSIGSSPIATSSKKKEDFKLTVKEIDNREKEQKFSPKAGEEPEKILDEEEKI